MVAVIMMMGGTPDVPPSEQYCIHIAIITVLFPSNYQYISKFISKPIGWLHSLITGGGQVEKKRPLPLAEANSAKCLHYTGGSGNVMND